MVRTNREQAGVFTLRTGVRLQRHCVITRALDEHCFETVDQFLVAQCLRRRCQRMDVRELRPRHRNHFRRRVELHRARTQRDHRAVHRQILIGQRTQITQQLMLTVVRVEHRVRHERRGANG